MGEHVLEAISNFLTMKLILIKKVVLQTVDIVWREHQNKWKPFYLCDNYEKCLWLENGFNERQCLHIPI